MNSYALPRVLVVVLTLVLVTTGLATARAAAAETVDWSDKESRENVLVQDCHGSSVVSGFSPTLAFGFDFEIISSYTVDRDFSLITDYTGIDHPVMERRYLSFAGIAANSTSGLSLAYDGHFTRTGNYAQGDFTITDIALHIVPANEEDVTVTVDRDSSGLIDSPEAVLLAYASRGLNTSLCGFFVGLKIAG